MRSSHSIFGFWSHGEQFTTLTIIAVELNTYDWRSTIIGKHRAKQDFNSRVVCYGCVILGRLWFLWNTCEYKRTDTRSHTATGSNCL